MIRHFLKSILSFPARTGALLGLAVPAALFLGGCATTGGGGGGNYHTVAYAPANPGDVRVKVSPPHPKTSMWRKATGC